jgi:uncharacterized protein YqgV (UPF0045/DUF77 family)
VILYFILKYKPAIENAVNIIDNLDPDSLDTTVTKVNDVVRTLNSKDVSTAITAIENIVDKLDVDDVSDAINTIQDVVNNLEGEEVTAAINTIEDVAKQLNDMMDGTTNFEKTRLGQAIEKYACTNLIPTNYTAKIWDGWNINNSVSSVLPTIDPITYKFDIRNQVDACKKYT